MKRWICPLCDKGKMAPTRMKAEDSRRFCFSCSDETGMLVRRACPALEKARQKAEAKRKVKAQRERVKAAKGRARKREREAKARSVGHLDLKAELRRLSGYKVLRADLVRMAGNKPWTPALTITKARKQAWSDISWQTGYRWEIEFKVGTQEDAASAAAWLCVALAHYSKRPDKSRANTWDNTHARDVFCQLAETAYKVSMMGERWETNPNGLLVPRTIRTLHGILADKLRENMTAAGELQAPPKETKTSEPRRRQYGMVTLGVDLRAKVVTFLSDYDEYLDDFDALLPELAERIRGGARIRINRSEIPAVRVLLEEVVHDSGPLPANKLMEWLDMLEAE